MLVRRRRTGRTRAGENGDLLGDYTAELKEAHHLSPPRKREQSRLRETEEEE